MTIRELYEDAVRYDEKTLAHYIILLLREGKLSLQDKASKMAEVQPNIETLKDMINKNELGLNPVKIYTLKVNSKKFAFIFAESEEKAIEHFKKSHRSEPLNCIEMSLDELMAVGNRFLTFRDYRNELNTFPYLAGYYERS